jgi:hypothetical protein
MEIALILGHYIVLYFRLNNSFAKNNLFLRIILFALIFIIYTFLFIKITYSLNDIKWYRYLMEIPEIGIPWVLIYLIGFPFLFAFIFKKVINAVISALGF